MRRGTNTWSASTLASIRHSSPSLLAVITWSPLLRLLSATCKTRFTASVPVRSQPPQVLHSWLPQISAQPSSQNPRQSPLEGRPLWEQIRLTVHVSVPDWDDTPVKTSLAPGSLPAADQSLLIFFWWHQSRQTTAFRPIHSFTALSRGTAADSGWRMWRSQPLAACMF